ncbi:MAG: sterol desaturase family protein [Acidobacteria bacterium]|nr:sterol desaturase family protein [Acidobacteriota bacterium]
MDFQQFLGPFTVISFVLFGALETFQPLTTLTLPFLRRWTFHLAIWIATSYLLVLALRISSVNYAATTNPLCPGLLFFLIDDFALWLIHFSLHRFGWLWPWHSTHHSDPDMDASTGFRFHPVETILDQSCHLLLVYFLQPSVSAVLATQFISIAHNFWVHSNTRFPQGLDRLLSLFIVTPSLHRSHHAQDLQHQNANYGITLTLWDRLFRTFKLPAINPQVGLPGIPPKDTMHPYFALIQLPWNERPRR